MEHLTQFHIVLSLHIVLRNKNMVPARTCNVATLQNSTSNVNNPFGVKVHDNKQNDNSKLRNVT